MNIDNLSNLHIGKAGEYLVCADLILKGFTCYPSEQGLPYDVVLDNGNKLIKVQVKTTKGITYLNQRKNLTGNYLFDVKTHGNRNSNRYKKYDVDIFALVCLDIMKIGYITFKDARKTLIFRADELRGQYYDEKGIKDYERVMDLYKTIKNQSEISRRLGINGSTVNRMVKNGYIPYKSKARYFSDIIRGYEWFNKI